MGPLPDSVFPRQFAAVMMTNAPLHLCNSDPLTPQSEPEELWHPRGDKIFPRRECPGPATVMKTRQKRFLNLRLTPAFDDRKELSLNAEWRKSSLPPLLFLASLV